MTDNKKPKPLQLADALDDIAYSLPTDKRGWTEDGRPQNPCTDAAAELRRLAAVLAEQPAEQERATRLAQQAAGTHPAPCSGSCEAAAFRAEIRAIKAECDALRSKLERIRSLEPVAWMDDFGNTFPLSANKGAGSWLDDYKRTWKPLYTLEKP